MNQVNQGEGSVVPFAHQVKKRRGRPRKDTNLKHARAAHAPPGFEVKQEYHPQRAYKTNADSMVGQAVTGVVEATFDTGYLLALRIGNSNTNFRGVVFKPGHYAPITAETVVAPHLQMIKRNDVRLPHDHQSWSRIQKLSIQTTGLVPSKLKYPSPVTAPLIPPVGARGTVVPVVLQPVNRSNGFSGSNQMPSVTSRVPHVMAFGNKDDHVVESSAMLPQDQSILASQIFVTTQSNSSLQVPKGSEKNDNVSSLNEGIPVAGHGEEGKPMKSTDVISPDLSQSTDSQVESDSEAWVSSPENSGMVSNQETGNSNEPFLTESLQTTFVAKPLFTYGSGRMTELLKAVHENIKDSPMQIAEQLSFASQVEFHATRSAETDPKNEASSP
ncbi:uncharacterized protein [Primulina eburnea]|uniref:uncharacterized protein n=1 Tax=Primulina eburnea TaxID=1245227 RepID=UPI003C6C08BC